MARRKVQRKSALMKRLKAIERNNKKRNQKKKKKLTKKQKAIRRELKRDVEERPKLYPSQIEGIEFLERNNFNAIIADSMGTGKTAQALVAVARNARALLPTLVVCPSSVAWNWRREAYKWIRSNVRVHVVEGMEDVFPNETPHITIVSWDLLHYRINDLLKFDFKCIIADEAHYAKNPESKRTKAFQQIESKHKILLTGTPLINEVQELNVLKCLIGTDNVPIIRRLLEDVAPHVPPKKRIIFPVELEPNLKEEYDEIKEFFGDWLDSYLRKIFGNRSDIEERVEKSLENEYLTKISYLRRVIGRGKVPAMSVWAKSMIKKGNSIVIYGEHHDVIDYLCESLQKLKVSHVRIDGTTGRTERQIAIDSFQNGAVKCFIGSRACLEGITLTRATNLAFLERYFTPASEEQAEDRIRRIGQDKETKIWYFTARDTIDERIQNIISRKRRIIDSEIGVESIQEEEFHNVFDSWKKFSSILNITKTLKEEPKNNARFPKLPKKEYVRGLIFDTNSWSIPVVQKSLRKRGHQILEMKTNGEYIFLSTRSPNQFDKKTVRKITVEEGLIVIVGKPVSNKQRVKNYR